MPATEPTAKAEKRASSQKTDSTTITAPVAKKRKLTPAEALIKSMTARKAIASLKKATGTHVTFGDNDEVIEKKVVAAAIPEESQKKKNKKQKKKASNEGSASTTTTSTASIFQNGSTGSILPTNPGTKSIHIEQNLKMSAQPLLTVFIKFLVQQPLTICGHGSQIDQCGSFKRCDKFGCWLICMMK